MRMFVPNAGGERLSNMRPTHCSHHLPHRQPVQVASVQHLVGHHRGLNHGILAVSVNQVFGASVLWAVFRPAGARLGGAVAWGA